MAGGKVTTEQAAARPKLLHVALLALAAGEDAPTRRRVYQVVQELPGLHQREIARRLDLIPSHAEYHLHQLTKAGLVRSETSGGYKRYYVAVQPSKGVPEGAVSRQDQPWVALLRQPRPLEIVAHLLQADRLQMGELADRMDIAASTLSYHVDKLEEAEIVARHREGNQRWAALVDRERTIRVLLQYEPPDDLVQGFEDLWDDIGF